MGNCRDKNVLDLACGNGYIARMLARKKARVAAIDSSLGMIRNAKAHDPKNKMNITYVQCDASNLKFDDASFDLVYANMSLMDIKNCDEAITEVSRVLREGGRLVASIPHPCFDNGSNSAWVAEKYRLERIKVYRRVRAYRKPFSEKVPWSVSNSERKYTWVFHRPLNWYTKVLSSNGFVITSLEEPEPTAEFLREESKKEGDLDALGFLEVPLHLVLEAVKVKSAKLKRGKIMNV